MRSRRSPTSITATRTAHDIATSASCLDRDDIDAVLIATGPNWHATAAMYAARAGKDMYCEKPCTKNIAQSLALADTMRRTGRVFQAGTQRRNLPHFAFACELARTGKLGKLHTVYAHPMGMSALMSGWLPAEPEPDKEVVDWDMYLGPASWRPFNAKLLDGFNFEKGGGLVGGGVLEWGSHCVDLCQWAIGADGTAPVEYNPPKDGQIVARYANGVKLVFRETGWIPLGSCPVRFEGETGWVEAGDSGKIVLSSPELIAGRTVAEIGGYPATFHVRDFLDCVKTRSQPKGERRRGLLRAHRLPCGEHRDRAESQGEVRPQEARVRRRRAGQSFAIRGAARAVADLDRSLAEARLVHESYSIECHSVVRNRLMAKHRYRILWIASDRDRCLARCAGGLTARAPIGPRINCRGHFQRLPPRSS